ncbi:MAG: S-layer homology domain-containing protein [Oscillospiraceae bacterium]|nr:S-layer homology domain-containing protein [Oscillospiraceae bacterium]
MQKLSRMLRALLITALLVAAVALCAAAADYTASNDGELYRAIYDALTDQKTTFTVEYSGKDMSRASPVAMIRSMAANLPNEDGNGGDVLMMNLVTANCVRLGNTLTFTAQYLLDKQQLAWTYSQVDEIVDELQLEGESDFVKVKRIYQYMGMHFTYDDTLTKFTDYDGLTDGTMVCQGYALLTYKLLWRVGVPARIVVGTSRGEPHGWNIVKLDGAWYNLDTTWDSTGSDTMYWSYFLKSDADFEGHERDPSFTTYAFNTACPMAKKSYDVHSVDITLDGQIYSGLTIRNGQTIQFGYTLHPEAEGVSVSWRSSDPAVASITEDGKLSSLTPGQINITATPSDDTYIPGTFPVTAVEMRNCSPWAEQELVSYYLRKLYPAVLCSDYQTPIHRDEYARLLRLLIAQEHDPAGNASFYTAPSFSDVGESPYWYDIAYCSGRGIFNGTGPHTFSPDLPLTREQAAKMLCNTLAYLGVTLREEAELTFADNDQISEWALPYVKLVVAAGIMEGTGENFEPKTSISREQAAVTLERIFVRYFEQTAENAA